jgi:ribosomal protein S14
MRALPEPHEFAAVPADCRWESTPRMTAYWEAIQDAKRRGLSGRAIARELGISRNTVRKYSMASQPPVHHGRRPRRNQQEALTSSLTSSP